MRTAAKRTIGRGCYTPATRGARRPFFHGLLAGWDPVKIAGYANAAGAIVASRLACADAMPTLDELRDLVVSQGGSA